MNRILWKIGKLSRNHYLIGTRPCFNSALFSSPGRSPGRAVVLPPALALVSAAALAKC